MKFDRHFSAVFSALRGKGDHLIAVAFDGEVAGIPAGLEWSRTQGIQICFAVGRIEFFQHDIFQLHGAGGVEPEIDPGQIHVRRHLKDQLPGGPLAVDQRRHVGQAALVPPLAVVAAEDHQQLGERAVFGTLRVGQRIVRAAFEFHILIEPGELRSGESPEPHRAVPGDFYRRQFPFGAALVLPLFRGEQFTGLRERRECEKR